MPTLEEHVEPLAEREVHEQDEYICGICGNQLVVIDAGFAKCMSQECGAISMENEIGIYYPVF